MTEEVRRKGQLAVHWQLRTIGLKSIANQKATWETFVHALCALKLQREKAAFDRMFALATLGEERDNALRTYQIAALKGRDNAETVKAEWKRLSAQFEEKYQELAPLIKKMAGVSVPQSEIDRATQAAFRQPWPKLRAMENDRFAWLVTYDILANRLSEAKDNEGLRLLNLADDAYAEDFIAVSAQTLRPHGPTAIRRALDLVKQHAKQHIFQALLNQTTLGTSLLGTGVDHRMDFVQRSIDALRAALAELPPKSNLVYLLAGLRNSLAAHGNQLRKPGFYNSPAEKEHTKSLAAAVRNALARAGKRPMPPDEREKARPRLQ